VQTITINVKNSTIKKNIHIFFTILDSNTLSNESILVKRPILHNKSLYIHRHILFENYTFPPSRNYYCSLNNTSIESETDINLCKFGLSKYL